MIEQAASKNTEEEIQRGKALALWIRNGLAKKGWKVADLQRATKYSKGWLSRITYKNGINTTTGAYSRPGEEKIDLIALTLEIDANEGRRAAGYADATPVDEPMHHFKIGEFRGKPVEVLLPSAPTDEQLERMRIATQIIFSSEKTGGGSSDNGRLR